MGQMQMPMQPAPKKSGGMRTVLIVVGGIMGCAVLVCGGLLGFGAYLNYQDEQRFNSGLAAYSAGNCAEALTIFGTLETEEKQTQATSMQQHCQNYQAAADQHRNGQYGAALLGYLNTAQMSAGLDSVISTQVTALFDQAPADQLASVELCDQVENLSTNYPSMSAVMEPRTADLHAACGDFYVEQGQYEDAIFVYEKFLDDYPTHEMADTVEDSLAEALVAWAKAAGAGNIPAPEVSGTTGGISTVVIIQNDSPESMRIVFTGPETRIEELPACTNCQTYFGTGPEFCPEIGPSGTYELAPGTYEVLVTATSDSGTTPFTGTWSLASGDEYFNCFYIVESTVP